MGMGLLTFRACVLSVGNGWRDISLHREIQPGRRRFNELSNRESCVRTLDARFFRGNCKFLTNVSLFACARSKGRKGTQKSPAPGDNGWLSWLLAPFKKFDTASKRRFFRNPSSAALAILPCRAPTPRRTRAWCRRTPHCSRGARDHGGTGVAPPRSPPRSSS